MTQTTLPGRTGWEADEYARDHGKTAAQAIGYQLMARHINTCATEDMAILGLREIPAPRPQSWPVTGGPDEERRARIDAWAARHGIAAHHDPASGQYKALPASCPVLLTAYMIPDRLMTDPCQA